MKKVGISRFDTQKTSYTTLSTTLSTQRAQQLRTQLDLFKEILLSSKELMNSPQHRAKFLSLCTKIGINPLSLYDKEEDLNEFYSLLCLKLIEFWNETRGLNGGLVSLDAFEKNNSLQLTEQDWNLVLEQLRLLSPGVMILELGSRFVSFNGEELGLGEESKILAEIVTNGNLNEEVLLVKFGDGEELSEFRIKESLSRLVMNGYVWIDVFEGVTTYYDPSGM